MAKVAGERGFGGTSLSHRFWKIGLDRAAEEDRHLCGCPSRDLPLSALPAPPSTFIDPHELGALDNGEAAPPTLDKEAFPKRHRLGPRLVAEVTNERWILVHVRGVHIALPPHPRLWIDAESSRSMTLAMTEHLAASG